MKKLLLSVFAVSTMLSGVAADGMPEKKSRSSDAGWRFEVGALGGGSMTDMHVSSRLRTIPTPHMEGQHSGLGGHGGGYLSAGYRFSNACVLFLQAQGSFTNDSVKVSMPSATGVLVNGVVRAVKVKRDYTYAGSLGFGKEIGSVLPYVKLGWRHNHYNVLELERVGGLNLRESHDVSTGGLMAGFGVSMNFAKGITVGVEADYSVASRKTVAMQNINLASDVKIRPRIAQVAFKLGYQF